MSGPLDVRRTFKSRALSETLLPAVGLTVNCKYLLPETADANVVPEKFIELNEFESGIGLMPAPRESVLVLRRTSVVVEAIVASLPAFPARSQARITVSTNGAEGSTIVIASDDMALSGETLAIVGSNPKKLFYRVDKSRARASRSACCNNKRQADDETEHNSADKRRL